MRTHENKRQGQGAADIVKAKTRTFAQRKYSLGNSGPETLKIKSWILCEGGVGVGRDEQFGSCAKVGREVKTHRQNMQTIPCRRTNSSDSLTSLQ